MLAAATTTPTTPTTSTSSISQPGGTATRRQRGRRPIPKHQALTLTDAAKLYCEDCCVQGYKPSTITGYQRTLRCFLRWAAGEGRGLTLVAHFSADAVKRYLNLANQEAIETHRVNSPADKHRALRQAGTRRMPLRQRSHPVVSP